jgi:hypothetical protein
LTNQTKYASCCRLLEFLWEDRSRLKLVVYWAVLLGVFTQGVVPLSSALSLRRIVVRKLFHALAALMFFPATTQQVETV